MRPRKLYVAVTSVGYAQAKTPLAQSYRNVPTSLHLVGPSSTEQMSEKTESR